MILIDTSGLLAALFPDQNHHEECMRVLKSATRPLILSPLVLAEADYLIHKYGGLQTELVFLDEVGRGAYDIPMIDEADVAGAYKIIKKYRELQVGLTDASLCVLAERRDCRDILTLDHRHFGALRFGGGKRFRIHPAPMSSRA